MRAGGDSAWARTAASCSGVRAHPTRADDRGRRARPNRPIPSVPRDHARRRRHLARRVRSGPGPGRPPHVPAPGPTPHGRTTAGAARDPKRRRARAQTRPAARQLRSMAHDRVPRRPDRVALRRAQPPHDRPRGHRGPQALRGGRARVPPPGARREARRGVAAHERRRRRRPRAARRGRGPRGARDAAHQRGARRGARGGHPPRDGRARPQRRQERDRRDPAAAPAARRPACGRATSTGCSPATPSAGASPPSRWTWATASTRSPSRATAPTRCSSTRAARTACSACPPPSRRAASTPRPPPSRCCPRPRTSTSRSTPTTCRSTCTAPAAPAASRSTRPTRRCASRTSRRASSSRCRTRRASCRTARRRCASCARASTSARWPSSRPSWPPTAARQVGTGERAEKIRTYNYRERRVTDHRIKLTVHNLDAVLEGELDEFTAALQDDEKRRGLEAQAADVTRGAGGVASGYVSATRSTPRSSRSSAARVDTPAARRRGAARRTRSGVDRAALLLDPDREVAGDAGALRSGTRPPPHGEREPVAYLVGRKGFRHLELASTPRVLVPRPETEHLVEAALDLPAGRARRSTSAPAAARSRSRSSDERPDLRVSGHGREPRTRWRSRAPTRARLGPRRRRFAQADLLARASRADLDAVLSNPPYVADGDRRRCPRRRCATSRALALFARRRRARRHPPRWSPQAAATGASLLALEVGAGQAPAVRALVARRPASPTSRSCRDLAGDRARGRWAADDHRRPRPRRSSAACAVGGDRPLRRRHRLRPGLRPRRTRTPSSASTRSRAARRPSPRPSCSSPSSWRLTALPRARPAHGRGRWSGLLPGARHRAAAQPRAAATRWPAGPIRRRSACASRPSARRRPRWPPCAGRCCSRARTRRAATDARRLADVPGDDPRRGRPRARRAATSTASPSTVIDLRRYEDEGAWAIVRQGALSAEAVGLALGGRPDVHSARHGDRRRVGPRRIPPQGARQGRPGG